MTTLNDNLVSECMSCDFRDNNTGTLLGICTSLKPALGYSGKSATRSIISYALESIKPVYPNVSLLDIRDHPLPFFDGRMPQEYVEPSVRFIKSRIDQSSAILLSIPAYWSGVSGVFKNFVDILCGPIYDIEGTVETIFTNKPVGLLVVGADDSSTIAGSEQAQQIMLSTGAHLVGQPISISNPRKSHVEPEELSRDLIVLCAELARHALLATKGNKP